MLGVHAHAPHDPSRTSARGSCGRHRRSPLRPRSTHTPAMPSDASGGWPCLHPPCVSSRAHHPAHYSAHGHMQRRAYMRALAHVYMRNVAYAHSTSLTRHTCAHMRTCTCTQPDRPLHTHRRDITGKTHPDTHMHTQAHTCTHARTHRVACVMYTQVVHTRTHFSLLPRAAFSAAALTVQVALEARAREACSFLCIHIHTYTQIHISWKYFGATAASPGLGR